MLEVYQSVSQTVRRPKHTFVYLRMCAATRALHLELTKEIVSLVQFLQAFKGSLDAEEKYV